LTGYQYSTGGKTGFTKRANRTLVTTASKNDIGLVAVTLNGPNDWNDHTSMFEFGFQHYQLKNILKEGVLPEIKSIKGKEFYLKSEITYPLLDKEEEEIKIEYKLLPIDELKKKVSGQSGLAIVYLRNEP